MNRRRRSDDHGKQDDNVKTLKNLSDVKFNSNNNYLNNKLSMNALIFKRRTMNDGYRYLNYIISKINSILDGRNMVKK